MSKIFITGGSGFIGRQVVKLAKTYNYKVIAPATRLHLIKKEDIEGCDTLIHLAAAGVNNPKLDCNTLFKVNVIDSRNLWESAADWGIKKFIICGSCFEYGKTAEYYTNVPTNAELRPTTNYSASKAAATMAAISFGIERNLKVLIVRPFQVYGDGEAETRFYPSLIKAALSGQDFSMTLGEQIRDFIKVEDVAKKIWMLDSYPIIGGIPEIINMGNQKATSIKQFAEYWWERLDAKGILKIGALPYRKNDVKRYVS